MTTLATLRAQVQAGYDRLAMPSWPNPHAGPVDARQEEYSRITEPGRYAVVHARARLWAEQLGALPGVEARTLAPGPVGADDAYRFDRGVRLTSSRPGTLPLLLLERDAPITGSAETLPVLHIGVVRPGIEVQLLPDCGCDACDWGSADLLDAIDDTVTTVVGGPFVALLGDGWHAYWHPDGGSSGGTGAGPDHGTVMELCRRLADGQDVRLPGDARAFVGGTWLD